MAPKCGVCGQESMTTHSCAGGVPLSNLPQPCSAVVSVVEMERRIAAAVEAEREACAKVAKSFYGAVGDLIAAKIRARGKP